VAQKYEKVAVESRSEFDAESDFKIAVKLYAQLGDTAAPRRIAKSIFTRGGDLNYTLEFMKTLGVQPDTEFFIARGDYEMSPEGKDQSWRAAESYIHRGNRDKVSSFMIEAERRAGENGSWYNQAREAAEFLGDRAHALDYVKHEFMVTSSTKPTNDEMKMWARVGLTPTPDLYR